MFSAILRFNQGLVGWDSKVVQPFWISWMALKSVITVFNNTLFESALVTT